MEYLFADLIAFIPWLLFFSLRKDLRKEMLTMSILSVPLAVFDLFYVPTYWKPTTLLNLPIGIEGFIFSFLIGGIAAVSYAEISHKKLKKIVKHNRHFALTVLILIIPMIVILQYFYPTNISIAMYIALLLGISLTVYIRKDLLKSTVAGAIVFGFIYSVALLIWSNLFPSTQSWFILERLPRMFILNMPLYEIIFGFIFGAYWGNIYELIFGYRFK